MKYSTEAVFSPPMTTTTSTTYAKDQIREENLAAQRAAVEAVVIGRETLEAANRQGEQLERAEAIADETEYKLDRATRLLRGMTWSGWVTNMFSTQGKGSPPPPADVKASLELLQRHEIPVVYENIPDSCRQAAQAVQNYHANVKVLESCETEDQKQTCRLICNDMHAVATTQIQSLLQTNPHVQAYVMQFTVDLETLRQRQEAFERNFRVHQIQQEQQRVELMGAAAGKSTAESSQLQEQDDHLNFISKSLNELSSTAFSLNQQFSRQNETIQNLDQKSESILDKTRMVTRRSDRLIQDRAWTPIKPTFHGHVTIRHVETGAYLSVSNRSLVLVPRLHPETCVFKMWKRQGQVFGLQSVFSGRWVGQTLLGGVLSCSATSFGRREEWEASETDWSQTGLLCASAGWGTGGYLCFRLKDAFLFIGGATAEDKKKASFWAITDYSVEQ